MNLSFPQMPEKLTSTEQDIVEYIAAHRDEFLCMTIGQLSAALHISEATVSRFARHVGCEDFKHLKRTVVEQTIQRGPVQKLSNTLQAKEGDILAAWLEQQRYNLQKTLDLLDRDAFAAAVAALLGARKIFLHARNASRAPAVLLEYRLRRIGLEVEQLPSAGSELPSVWPPSVRRTWSCCSALPRYRRRPGSFWTGSSRPATGPSFSPAAFGTARALAPTLNSLSTAGTKRNSTR